MANGKTRCWIKQGVTHKGLKKEARKAWQKVYEIYEKYGLDTYLTSGLEGNHMCGSLHYAGLAIDIKLPSATYLEFIHNDIIRELGDKGYDIVLHEKSHFHIEYDPK